MNYGKKKFFNGEEEKKSLFGLVLWVGGLDALSRYLNFLQCLTNANSNEIL